MQDEMLDKVKAGERATPVRLAGVFKHGMLAGPMTAALQEANLTKATIVSKMAKLEASIAAKKTAVAHLIEQIREQDNFPCKAAAHAKATNKDKGDNDNDD